MGPPGMAPPGMAPPGMQMPQSFIAPPGTVPEAPGQGMKHPGSGMDDDDMTPAKKMRTEDNLMAENDFLIKQKVGDGFTKGFAINIFFLKLKDIKLSF